ncbi:MAG: hypothetical protein BWY67_02505 [Bacteroidetes bacterium ADurb.Bin397]|nr:MAG: hypothetical protein BWY67_02505 [Bacteroidetes bacterium ADurb.Bin397]
MYWVERENGFIVSGTTSGANREELIYWPGSQISGIDVGNYDFSNVEEDKFSLLEGVIFPNPADDYITLNLNGVNADKIEVYDATGKLFSINIISTDQPHIFIGNLYPGIYLIKIFSNDKDVITLRFTKN